ncbi:MAG: GumC family protein [Blastocatellia bacterium]
MDRSVLQIDRDLNRRAGARPPGGELWISLQSRWRLCLAVSLLIIVSGVSVTMLWPRTYASSMKILISRAGSGTIAPDGAPGQMVSDATGEKDFNSAIEIIGSRQIIEAVITQMDLARQYGREEANAWPAQTRAWLGRYFTSLAGPADPGPAAGAVRRVMTSLEIHPVSNSRVAVISYRDTDPERAALVLDVLYRNFQAHLGKLRQVPETSGLFRQQADKYKSQLDQATQSLRNFDAQFGSGSVGTQRELLVRQYYQLEEQANAARTETRELEQRVTALQEQIVSQPERIETGVTTRYAPAPGKLRDELMQLELQRRQMLQNYKPDSRPVRELDTRMAQIREVIAREEASPSQEKSIALNEVRQRMTNDLLAAQANLTAMRVREETLRDLAGQYQARLIQLDRKGYEKTELERQRSSSEQAWMLFQQKSREAQIADTVARETMPNVTLADAPGPDYRPLSPRPLLSLALLTLAGLLAGASAAVIAERMDPVVRGPESVRRRLGADVLGAISDAG